MNRKLISIAVIVLLVLLIGVFYYKSLKVDDPVWNDSIGDFCGGIAGIECPVGYTCHIEENYPDASGYCVSFTNK